MIKQLASIRYTLKDLFCVKNEYVTYGLKDRTLAYFSTYDSKIKNQLDQLGLKYVGRSICSPFGCGTLGNFELNGILVGASSTGSPKDLLDNRCEIAVCSDTGGSCRVPAIRADLIGFKPTYDAISRHGLTPLCNQLDTVSFMVKDIDLLRIVMPKLNLKPYLKQQTFTGFDLNLEERMFLSENNLNVTARTFSKQYLKKIGRYYSALCYPDFYSNMCRINERNVYTRMPFSNKIRSKVLPLECKARIIAGAIMLKKGTPQISKPRLPKGFIITPAEPDSYKKYDKYDASYLCLANISGRPAITLPFGKRGLQIIGPKKSDLGVIEIAKQFLLKYSVCPY